MAFAARVRLVSSWSSAALSAAAGLSIRAVQCEGNCADAERPKLHKVVQEKQPGVIRIMSFNVKFYSQFSCVLAELGNMQIKYGPFSHTGLIQSQEGFKDFDQDNHGRLPVIQGNFDAVCKFLQSQRPDVVAIQEGVKDMDISVKDIGYSLQTLSSAFDPKNPSVILANQVLLNTENPLIEVVDSWHLMTKVGGNGPEDESRFAAGLRVYVAGQPLDIVSTHLTGGRFDDKKWRQYRTQRLKEISCVIEHKFDPTVPMIILGDFNAPSTAAEVSHGYGRALGATSDDDLEMFTEYMIGVHGKLQQLGWKPAYTKDDLSIPTSVFGGTVDWVYTSPNWPESIRLVGIDVLDVVHASSEPWASYPAGSSLKLSLSDHNAVVLDFQIL
eukprot:TRINITY_DN13896_c0_g1_i2.p1 TRINITY_DN13896_c0_g1~~TRINITY_DN13896_c0_g1_i2.p1  ORF type:complete len:402 (+),score=55.17 TRINITY_DN13896_c0_g1_i2:54-1208(+)